MVFGCQLAVISYRFDENYKFPAGRSFSWRLERDILRAGFRATRYENCGSHARATSCSNATGCEYSGPQTDAAPNH